MTNGHILKIHSNNVALQEQTLQIDKEMHAYIMRFIANINVKVVKIAIDTR